MRGPFAPWQVWWIDFDPTMGREQAKKRPAVIVSSRFHLELTQGALLTVLPLTTVKRPWSWRPEIHIPGKPASWAVTEQIRTVSATRVSGSHPAHHLTPSEIANLKNLLSQMLTLDSP